MTHHTEVWMARGATHTTAELSSLRTSRYQVSWYAPLHFHLHRGRDAGFPAPCVTCLEPQASLEVGRGGRLTRYALVCSPS